MLDHVTKIRAEVGHTVLPINCSLHGDGLDNTHLVLPSTEDREKFDITDLQLHALFWYRYTFEKKDSTTSKPKKDKLSISFNFCPICGEAYKKPKVVAPEQ